MSRNIQDKSFGPAYRETRGKPSVFVALSGGVDSSVAAALLVRSGNFRVVGAHMKCWGASEAYSYKLSADSCSAEQDAEDARRVAETLSIPFYVFDFEKEYRQTVFEYMVREYAQGLTPNPDVVCNKEIKFGIFLQKALEFGADYIATGHYVRREPEFPISHFQFPNKGKIETCKLKIAQDLNKDQSYFLWTLTQEQLEHSLFPIGNYVKQEVRAMAREFGLSTHDKKDSQGLCFVGNIDFGSFMREQLPTHKGKVVTVRGKEIGTHDGVEFYTIGQRHGINIGGGIPFYVTEKDVKTNTVVVAEGPYDDALFRNELVVRDAHWISGAAPDLPLECEVRIRYRQPLQKASIQYLVSSIKEVDDQKSPILNTKYVIQFSEPQRAVTPGQSVVFYKDDEMLGGGIITA